MSRALSFGLVALVATGCGRAAELEAARHGHVAQLIPADVNKDGVLDLIVGYDPTRKDDEGERFDLLEAIDGKTQRVLWTSRQRRWLYPAQEEQRGVVVGRNYFAVTWARLDDKPPGDGHPVVSVHDLMTGRVVWEREFQDSVWWVGTPFRVWPQGDTLLVFTNRVHPGGTLRMFDFATGIERWALPVEDHVVAAPTLVDGALVMTTRFDKPSKIIRLDPGEPPRVLPLEIGTRHPPIIANNEIWMACRNSESCADDAEKQARDQLAGIPTNVVVRIDPRSGQQLAQSKTRVPIDMELHMRYRDGIIGIEELHASEVHFTRLGERATSWRYEADGAIATFETGHEIAEHAPDAAYQHAIPGRYLPLFVTSEATRLVILDLETGKPSWESQPFKRWAYRAPIVYGSHYYVNLPAAGNALLAINATTGTFDGVYLIAIGNDADTPNLNTFDYAPNPWDFQGRFLVGHRREREFWMIDLEANKLHVASPGVQLVTPWQDVERVLGPVPRRS